jgi:hypothetical protein
MELLANQNFSDFGSGPHLLNFLLRSLTSISQ